MHHKKGKSLKTYHISASSLIPPKKIGNLKVDGTGTPSIGLYKPCINPAFGGLCDVPSKKKGVTPNSSIAEEAKCASEDLRGNSGKRRFFLEGREQVFFLVKIRWKKMKSSWVVGCLMSWRKLKIHTFFLNTVLKEMSLWTKRHPCHTTRISEDYVTPRLVYSSQTQLRLVLQICMHHRQQMLLEALLLQSEIRNTIWYDMYIYDFYVFIYTHLIKQGQEMVRRHPLDVWTDWISCGVVPMTPWLHPCIIGP